MTRWAVVASLRTKDAEKTCRPSQSDLEMLLRISATLSAIMNDVLRGFPKSFQEIFDIILLYTHKESCDLDNLGGGRLSPDEGCRENM